MANVYWREYLAYLLQLEKDTVKYRNALPDTLVWNRLDWKPDTSQKAVILNNPYSEYYLVHPAFNYYPVVGISYEQAIGFCKWRTLAANQAIYFKEKHIKDLKLHIKDTFPIRFYYRLPSKEEWEMAASGGLDKVAFPYGMKKTQDKKNRLLFNTREVTDSFIRSYDPHSYRETPITTNVHSYYANDFNLYNMTGNVAEMIAEKGIAKGGSFFHPLDSCKINMDQRYNSTPEMWLGFRCVAVMVK